MLKIIIFQMLLFDQKFLIADCQEILALIFNPIFIAKMIQYYKSIIIVTKEI